MSPLTSLYLSLTTLPYLLGTLALKSLEAGLAALGEASEEVFRGDRLPLLDFPDLPEGGEPEV